MEWTIQLLKRRIIEGNMVITKKEALDLYDLFSHYTTPPLDYNWHKSEVELKAFNVIFLIQEE